MHIPNIDVYSFTGTAVILGYLLTCEFNIDEQSALGAWFNVIGDILVSISSYLALLQTRYDNSLNESDSQNDDKDHFDILNEALDKLKEKVSEIEKNMSS